VTPASAAQLASQREAIAECRAVLEEKSKSFALASRLLPARCRDPVAVLYAFCRRLDDAIDLAPPEQRPAALARLRAEVADIYAGRPAADRSLEAFAAVARAHALPRLYLDELLAGMEMDVSRTGYQTLEELYLYGHRVAGVVGLLLCHVMGVRDERALRHAAHLGIAMQLTNICRDVEEDLRDGRAYLPRALLSRPLGSVPPPRSDARQSALGAVERLLDEADRFYRSAEAGLAALPVRCAFAVRAASLIYAAIGDELRARGCDPFLGRAVVPGWKKLWLIARALGSMPRLLLRSTLAPSRRAPLRAPGRTLLFPRDVLPLAAPLEEAR